MRDGTVINEISQFNKKNSSTLFIAQTRIRKFPINKLQLDLYNVSHIQILVTFIN